MTTRTVVGNISLSLDGRVAGPGGDYDMSWIVPHAVTDGSRAHMTRVTSAATTALLGRKNYQGFGGYWPAVADDATRIRTTGRSRAGSMTWRRSSSPRRSPRRSGTTLGSPRRIPPPSSRNCGSATAATSSCWRAPA